MAPPFCVARFSGATVFRSQARFLYGADIVDLDYFSPVGEARAAMGPTQTLLGNMDPVRVIRNQTPQQIYEAKAACHREAGSHFIVGAGCEIPRGTADDNVHALRRYAREHH